MDLRGQCDLSQVHNPSETIFVPRGFKPPPWKPSEQLLMAFSQSSPGMDYQYVLVIICMFSSWIEVFPCHKADAQTVAKKLLENGFPTWGIHFHNFQH